MPHGGPFVGTMSFRETNIDFFTIWTVHGFTTDLNFRHQHQSVGSSEILHLIVELFHADLNSGLICREIAE